MNEIAKGLRRKHPDYLRLRAELNKKVPRRSDIYDQIQRDNLEATRQDISDWQDARLIALDVDVPDWSDLTRVYNDMMVDSFLTGITETIKDNVKATEFEIVNQAGEVDEEKTELFEQEWFFKYLDADTESIFHPYSMIYLGDMMDDMFTNLKTIDREYIVKQHDFIKKYIYSIGAYQHGVDGWDVKEKEMEPYYILLKSDIELGLLDRVAPMVLGKKHLLISMFDYAEKYGAPIRVGKTDIEDPVRRKNMELMLSNMGRSMWTSMHNDDELELLKAGDSASGGANLFIDGMNYCNSEISKALLGTDSLMSEKSFVGSAEIGERLFEARGKSYLRKRKFNINNQLIPRMIKYGINLTGFKFRWVNEDKVSYDQKIEAVKVLTPVFKMDAMEVGGKLGFTLEEKEIEETPQEQAIKAMALHGKSNTPQLKAMYDDDQLPIKALSETKKDFVKRCMSDPNMVSQYPESSKRMAKCNEQYKISR